MNCRAIFPSRLENASIKRKLALVSLLTSGMALLLAFAAFVTVEMISSRNSIVRDLNVLADVVAINTTAALSFQNAGDANETLAALSAEPQIVGAWLYNENGKLFASYRKHDQNLRQAGRTDSSMVKGLKKFQTEYKFSGKDLFIGRPILLNNKPIGSIRLQASLEELYARLRLYAGIVLISLLGSLLGAFLISSRFRRSITDPILSLASTAKRVADNGNYSLRATKQSNDEIGLFTDGFNQMLSVIEERETALKKGNKTLEEQITARIQAEDQLRVLNEELEQRVAERTRELKRSNEELEQFAYIASHDLQEPLRIVSSYVQLIETRYEGKLDEEADRFIDFAVDGVKRMQALIKALLAYSRVGARRLACEPISCEEIVNSTIADLRLAAEECGAVITHDSLPTVFGDGTQLAQLFQNLLANALKFRGENPPSIHISANRSGEEWIFSVKDNGIGIEPTYYARIFVIFQRLHSQREYPGTGIGLAVCKKIVDRHGGRIWVQSEAGKGATFFFTIPAGGPPSNQIQ